MSRPWTTAEEALVRDRYESEGSTVLAVELGRSRVAVRMRAFRLGIQRQAEKYQGKPCRRGHSGVRFRSNWNCVECTW